jgi:PHIKZ082
LSFKDKAIVATTQDFLGTTPLPEEKFYKKLDELTPEVRRDRRCNVEFVIAPNSAQAVIEVFKRAHQWRPDFITGWNLMAFDIPRIVDALAKAGFDPAQILSDPQVPNKYRSCRYHKGTNVKRMSSGREQPLAGYEQWHWLSVPASFFFVDAMCLYYQIRRGGELEENYKLDTILTKQIKRGKVGIKECEHLDGVDKHRVMQTQYKIEYLVYNLFDCVGVELLDEKTKDICKTFSILAGVSDFGKYTSNPKLLSDALSFYVQENPDFNGVLGTVSDQMKCQLDSLVVPLSGWVVALPTERLLDNGLNFIEELPDHITKVHAQSSDIDVSSGYPNIERAMNMSKDTTHHELHRIEGIPFEQQRIIGLNMLGGKANSLSFAMQVYKLPHPREAYKHYLNSYTQH